MLRSALLLVIFNLYFASCALPGQNAVIAPDTRHDHRDPVTWAEVQRHLPNMATAPAEVLEQEGDLLRARHYPKDALAFYQAALSRFGETAPLLNKAGMTQMELGNVVLAESYFRRAVKRDSRNWQSWHNLAAIASLQRQYQEAVNDYKKAIKMNPANVVSHVSLCSIYFELKQYDKAAREAGEALRVDADAFTRDVGLRVVPRVVPAEDRARVFFAMARLFAQRNLETAMWSELAQAQENGMNLLAAMSRDQKLSRYVADPRLTSMLVVTKAFRRDGSVDLSSVSTVDPHTAQLDRIK